MLFSNKYKTKFKYSHSIKKSRKYYTYSMLLHLHSHKKKKRKYAEKRMNYVGHILSSQKIVNEMVDVIGNRF